jgi:hypothetical protein
MEATNETSPQDSRARTGLMTSARRGLLKVAIMAAIAFAFIASAPDKAWATFGVKPFVNCVTFDEFTNQMIVYWGFDNTNSFETTITNSFNFFVPGPSNRDQPITFPAGRNDYAFTTASDAGTPVTWVVGEFFATAVNDPNLYCSRVGPAAGQPFLAPAAITIQAGAPLQTFTIARVSSQRYQPGDILVAVSLASSAPVSVQNLTNTRGVVTAGISADASDSGSYDVVVTGSCGSATSTATNVTVRAAPSVTSQPTPKAASSGSTVTFTTAASGTPAPSIQWQVSTDGGATFSDIAGATTTTLQITASAGMDDHQYRAVFTNACGTAVTQSAAVVVFDKCLQSNNSGDHIQFNTTTGEYLFTHCGPGGFILSGKGVVSITGGTLVITDQKQDRLVKISYLPNQLTGNASISVAAAPGVWSSFVVNATNPNAPCSCM